MSSFAKIQITGIIKVKTGLHIGGSDVFSAIGAVNSPVIRDSLTKKPIIPGSSLKGKMRYLLVRVRKTLPELTKQKGGADGDPEEILQLFGSSKANEEGRLINSRLKFSDCFIMNDMKLKERVDTVTEVKYENSISRSTAVANPRPVERIIAGAEFKLEIIYDVDDFDALENDFKMIAEGFGLIENDYLGGGGTRGSGRVVFEKLEVNKAFGEIDATILEKLNHLLKLKGK
jgi:CRISPR-associated protein Csm3